ncbi:MAG: tRNA (adenosine(37)-N6)-dimethylallyltransferase [Thermoanaerobaculaceae bacterium]
MGAGRGSDARPPRAGSTPRLRRASPPRDRQRTLRALEVWAATGRPMSELWLRERRDGFRYRYVMLGLAPPRAELHARIAMRVDAMLASGLLDEVRTLLEQGVPRSAQAFKAIGYRECVQVLDGAWSLEQAREETIVATRRLAKRQLTWFAQRAGRGVARRLRRGRGGRGRGRAGGASWSNRRIVAREWSTFRTASSTPSGGRASPSMCTCSPASA